LSTNKPSTKLTLSAVICLFIGAAWTGLCFFAICLALAFNCEGSHPIWESFLNAALSTLILLPGILLLIIPIVILTEKGLVNTISTKTRLTMLWLRIIGILGVIFGWLITSFACSFSDYNLTPVSEKYMGTIVTIYVVLPGVLNIIVSSATIFKKTWTWKFIVCLLATEIALLITFWVVTANKTISPYYFTPSQVIYLVSASIALTLIVSDRKSFMEFMARYKGQTTINKNVQ
jgi:hypothetical protein